MTVVTGEEGVGTAAGASPAFLLLLRTRDLSAHYHVMVCFGTSFLWCRFFFFFIFTITKRPKHAFVAPHKYLVLRR